MGDMCDVLRAEVELDCSTKKRMVEQCGNILRPVGPSVYFKDFLVTLNKYLSKIVYWVETALRTFRSF